MTTSLAENFDMNNLDTMIAGRKKRKKKTNKQRKGRKQGTGGSFIADASVPAGLFLLHRYLKNKKTSKKSKKKSSKKLNKKTSKKLNKKGKRSKK